MTGLLLSFAALAIASSSALECTGVLEYQIIFRPRWTADVTVRNYPRAAHWSPMLVTSHASSYHLARVGAFATPGEKALAEVGVVGNLVDELQANSLVIDIATNLGAAPTGVSVQKVTITVDPQHPHISGMTMMAPSPDWFTGFRVNMCDEETGEWKVLSRQQGLLYDAGTDFGKTFEASNRPGETPDLIMAITETTGSEKYPFYNPGVPMPVLAEFLIETQAEGPAPPRSTRRRRRRRRTAAPSTTEEAPQQRRSRRRSAASRRRTTGTTAAVSNRRRRTTRTHRRSSTSTASAGADGSRRRTRRSRRRSFFPFPKL